MFPFPPRPNRFRAALFASLVLAIVATASADAAPVRIRGGARLEARARHVEPGVLELRGRLTDDDGAVIADQAVSIDTEAGTIAGLPEPCRSPRLAVSRARASRSTIVRSGPRGEICVRWSGARDEGGLELRFAGDDYHASAERTVPFDRASPPRWPVTLRFEPRPTVIDVDRDGAVVTAVVSLAETAAWGGEGGAPPSIARLPIVLDDGGPGELARGETSGDGKVRFTLAGARLGEPGDARLRVGFAGTDALEPASDEQPVTLRSTVTVRLAGPVPPWRPSERLTLELQLAAARGRVDGGVVEARVDGLPRATVPVRGGRATLMLAVDHEAERPPALSLRYVPASPSWLAGPDLEVALEMGASWRWGPWLWGVVVAVAALWTGLSWRRARRSAEVARPAEREKPGIRVVGRPVERQVWSGVVVDAHDGAPVAQARLSLHAPHRAADTPPILECSADDGGRFRFDFGGRPVGRDLELRVSGSHHSAEHSPLPPPGELRVVLTTRRRALLRRLVEWTRARGAPFAREPEPTPAEVAEAAGDDRRIANWAVAVERAAFDATEVDEAAERRVRRLEPATPTSPPAAGSSPPLPPGASLPSVVAAGDPVAPAGAPPPSKGEERNGPTAGGAAEAPREPADGDR